MLFAKLTPKNEDATPPPPNKNNSCKEETVLCQETPHCGAIDATVFPDFDMKCLNLLFFPL